MAFVLHPCTPAAALDALAGAIDATKDGDRLAPVTVVVPTNAAGVMARRALGRGRGILGVDMVTLNRLAELLAGPRLAHAKRQPVSVPLLDLTVRKVLDEAPGSYAAVVHHPATITALRELHRELRLTGDAGASQLATTKRGREAVRVSSAVTRLLRRRWYDEADLLRGGIDALATTRPAGLDRVVFHLPQPFTPLALEFVRALANGSAVDIVVALTGSPDADVEQGRLLDQLGLEAVAPPVAATPVRATPARVVSTTDADDEVRIGVRAVIDAARGATLGTDVPFDRIAILWPSHKPYARLVEHHLNADGIAWNGRGGIDLTERIAPRLLLDLLDVDRRGLRRLPLFQLLADVPSRDVDGHIRRTAEWERVSRAAGVSRDDDWIPRLGALSASTRWAEPAQSLSAFVRELRSVLGHPLATRSWSAWVEWSVEQLDSWLGSATIARMNDVEYRAWEALMSTLERLRCLDEVAEPVNRREFRTVLATELDEAAVRDGRIGTGVTIGSLASAGGLDIDVAVVLGAAEGMLPPPPRSDPLLSAADRERAGLAAVDQRALTLHHEFVAITQAAHTVVTWPRGDLRTAATHQPSRWLSHLDPATTEVVDSSAAGLAALRFAPCERERRLGDRLRAVTSGGPSALVDAPDATLIRNLAMRTARDSPTLTVYDGDLSEVPVPSIAVDPSSPNSPRPISPTQIKAWVSCPHGYFVRYLLGVQPVDEPDRSISIEARERGTVQHDVLDAFHRDVIAGRLAQPTEHGWTAAHRDALLHHFEERCDAAERAGRTGRPATWASERARMRADLLGWLEHDSAISRAHRTTILASEREFPDHPEPDESGVEPTTIALRLPDGRHVAVRGKIDRLDRRGDDTLVVTDHKTGSATAFTKISSTDPTLGGTEFQLPAYAAAALAWTAGSGSSAVRAEYSMFERGKYQRLGVQFDDDVWERVGADLARVVEGIESGWFPQVPEPPGFKMFTPCLFCAPDELDTDAPWARWTSKRHDERIARWFAQTPDENGDQSDDEINGDDA
jgi:RecB family exonuclease